MLTSSWSGKRKQQLCTSLRVGIKLGERHCNLTPTYKQKAACSPNQHRPDSRLRAMKPTKALH